MAASQAEHRTQREPSQFVLWVIAALLAVIAVLLWTDHPPGRASTALAQTRSAGAGGIYAFTGQLDRDAYGLFMLDIDQGTVWCYEIIEQAGVRKLRLMAGRTFIYDRYLKDYNCAPPDFRYIQGLVARQRQSEREPLTTDEVGTDSTEYPVSPAGE